MLTPGDCEKFMSSDGYRELLSLGIILAAVVFFSNHVLSYAQELPAKTDSISDITSEIAIPTATSSVQQQTPQEQFITPGLSSLSDRDNSIRNLPLEPETQEKATDLTMIQQKKKGTLTEQQIDNQELSKDIVSDKKQQLDKIMKDSLTESKSTFQPEDSEEKQQDEYSDDSNTDSDQEEIQQDERGNEEEENNNRQNNNDKDDNNNDNIPLEFPIPFP
jgi:hypothetical protein